MIGHGHGLRDGDNFHFTDTLARRSPLYWQDIQVIATTRSIARLIFSTSMGRTSTLPARPQPGTTTRSFSSRCHANAGDIHHRLRCDSVKCSVTLSDCAYPSPKICTKDPYSHSRGPKHRSLDVTNGPVKMTFAVQRMDGLALPHCRLRPSYQTRPWARTLHTT